MNSLFYIEFVIEGTLKMSEFHAIYIELYDSVRYDKYNTKTDERTYKYRSIRDLEMLEYLYFSTIIL